MGKGTKAGTGERLTGVVSAVMKAKNFGYITSTDPAAAAFKKEDGADAEFFFHATAVEEGLDFSEFQPGDSVSFIGVKTARGNRAVGIRQEPTGS
jgi:cold shock CspA family protein